MVNFIKINELKKIYNVLYDFFTGLLTSGGKRTRTYSFVGYILLFLISFIFFVLLTLPLEGLKNRIIYEFSIRKLGRLSISKLSYSFPLGLKMHKISYSSGDGSTDAEFLKADYLKVHQSPFSLLFGKINLSFSSGLYSGDASGRFKYDREDAHVYLNAKNLDVGEFSPLRELIGLQVAGRLNARIDIETAVNNITMSKGDIEIVLKDVKLKESNFLQIFKLPAITLNSLAGSATVGDGRMVINKFELEGGDLNGSISGDVTFRTPLKASLLNLNVRLKLSSQFQEQIGSILNTLNIRTDSAGYYMFNLGGTAGLPRAR